MDTEHLHPVLGLFSSVYNQVVRGATAAELFRPTLTPTRSPRSIRPDATNGHSLTLTFSPKTALVTRCWSARGILLIRIAMLLRKDQIEASLLEEKKLIEDGKLKEDNPLDLSETFSKLCDACRRGDLKVCQETITEGANINARDKYDYTPLILVCAPMHTSSLYQLLIANASRQG